MYVANKFAAHLKDSLINFEYDSFAKVTRVCVLALITMNSGRVPMSMMSLWSLLQDLLMILSSVKLVVPMIWELRIFVTCTFCFFVKKSFTVGLAFALFVSDSFSTDKVYIWFTLQIAHSNIQLFSLF